MSPVTKAQVHDRVLTFYQFCEAQLTAAERKEQEKYAMMVQNHNDKVFLCRMLDETSQIKDDQKLAQSIKKHIETYGIPRFFNKFDQALFKLYQATVDWSFVPKIALPIIKWRTRRDTTAVCLDAEPRALDRHLKQRADQEVGQNVNLLGEVVVGNNEADKRFESYLEALENPEINYISVKISGIYAQTHALNYEESLPELVRRMSLLYRKAIDFPYTDKYGVTKPKFINLDMEEYKDFHLTKKVFFETLSKPEFKNYEAGIVVQAYLPDAWDFQTELLEFANKRVAEGGSPIKMRLVKGCNLDMENVVSSLRGWPMPCRDSKLEVDACYMKILTRALLPNNSHVLHIGIAGHNLYTISYAYLLTIQYGTPVEDFCFEMLEGMANHVWRAQKDLGNYVLLYAPVVKDEHFLNAVSYLVRRLDENTGPENFLAYSFNLKPHTRTWDFLSKQFDDAYDMMDNLFHGTKRTQNRNQPYEAVAPSWEMKNEPDTDFDLPANQQWIDEIYKRWQKGPDNVPEQIPVQIGDKTTVTADVHIYKDRCAEDEVQVYSMCKAGPMEIEQILAVADEDPAGWRKMPLEKRHKILYAAANAVAEIRGELIGCMGAVTGKTIVEADVEVSEGIDYARFYTTSVKKFEDLGTVSLQPKGTILVISPWNFPCAIPMGGVCAALATGNTCILKPATVAAPVAWMFAQAMWKAGVPKQALQVVLPDRDGLKALTSSPVIKHIILTGGTDTARQILTANPDKPLSAETGGKNVMIITASADRDHAIMNACTSAFGNAGQKCSACSLLLVERSVYDDPVFAAKLADCATSMKVGSVWNKGNVVGPMITNRNDKLQQALKLDGDESWLVEPRWVDKKKFILAPTIKWGVAPDSFSFRTEIFAPLLCVAPFDTLDQAIEMVNSLDYGLTSGIQTLDENEWMQWRENIEAGNLYINRGITGAVVNRQPFGGMKASAFGGGVKAGGPNYVAQFMKFEDVPDKTPDYKASYLKAWKDEFSTIRDWNHCTGEQNLFRYRPIGRMAMRVFADDNLEDITKVITAAQIAGVDLTVSIYATDEKYNKVKALGVNVKGESVSEFANNIGNYERVRICSDNVPPSLFQAAAKNNVYVILGKPLNEGRVELVNYIREQSISYEYHRYGSMPVIPEDK